MYKVTYQTEVKPTDLPDGAVVEEVSILPLEIEQPGSMYNMRVAHYAGQALGKAFIGLYVGSTWTSGSGVVLTPEETHQVIQALKETLPKARYSVGDVLDGDEPGSEVLEIEDNDGDIYRRYNGTWRTSPTATPWPWKDIRDSFGPIIVTEVAQ